MSGLVVGYGEPVREDVERMLHKIGHRGPDLAGVCGNGQAFLAQNYAAADFAISVN